MLDAIVDNVTELTILEHITDTAGQRLYRFDAGGTYRHLGPLLKGKVRERLVLDHWDDLLRVAGSLVIDRLKAKGEQISPEQLARLSPARHEHINPYGHDQVPVDRWAGKKPLRPIKA